MKRAPSKERKELSVGATREEAIAAFPTFDETKHECTQTGARGLWQVFNRRKPPADRTIRKTLTRETAEEFMHYKRKIVVGFEPGDIISFRLKGNRKATTAPISSLYKMAMQWEAMAAMHAKRAERKARRAARRVA